jgi:hypothetical protein
LVLPARDLESKTTSGRASDGDVDMEVDSEGQTTSSFIQTPTTLASTTSTTTTTQKPFAELDLNKGDDIEEGEIV